MPLVKHDNKLRLGVGRASGHSGGSNWRQLNSNLNKAVYTSGRIWPNLSRSSNLSHSLSHLSHISPTLSHSLTSLPLSPILSHSLPLSPTSLSHLSHSLPLSPTHYSSSPASASSVISVGISPPPRRPSCRFLPLVVARSEDGADWRALIP